MTDRRASSEGHLGRLQPPNFAPEGLQDQSEDQSPAFGCHAVGSVPRRHSTRSKSSPDGSPGPVSPSWVDTNRGEVRKTKGGRSTSRKSPGDSSPRNSTSPRPSSADSQATERDTVGFLPKLSRILEGKESKVLRRRRVSTPNSAGKITRPRVRPTEDVISAKRAVRQKHGSLQRRAETLGNLPNPSLLSIVSSLTNQTNQTNTSSGSNSTITQKSYDKNHVSKPQPAKGRKRLQPKRTSTKTKTMDSSESSTNVFQYLTGGLALEPFVNGRPPSSSGTTSSKDSEGTDVRDDQPSNAEESETELPMTSPTYFRQPVYEENLPLHNRFSTHGVASAWENSPDITSQPLVNHVHRTEEEEQEDEEEEQEDEEEEQEDEEDEDEGTEDDNDENGNGNENENENEYEDGDESDDNEPDTQKLQAQERDPNPAPHLYAIEKAAPPRVPSTSSASYRSDRRYQRLRDQERELRDHVLQSPRPHRIFQPPVVPSPSPHPSVSTTYPASHAGTSASPAYPYFQAPQPSGWPPPVHPAPPIGYYSPPQVPLALYAENNHSMATRNHMAAAVQLPQHYQQYPPGPDLSKKTVIGYELVADKLTEVPKDDYESRTETRVVPMYRKFERLNHRVLLHLQDEISELEEELRYLDECIAQQSPSVQLGHIQPASRRAETRHGGEMHHRRTLLLGNIYTKLGQYNSALSSFSTMKKNLAPADPSEIRAYHKWMQKHAPIEQTETRFLEHKDDLLNLSGRNQTDSESTTATATATGGVGGVAGLAQSAVIGLPLILVLPLMAFALIPGLLGRLFIIGVVGAVEVAVVTSSVELMGFMTVKEWLYAASIYFGVLAVLAGVCV